MDEFAALVDRGVVLQVLRGGGATRSVLVLDRPLISLSSLFGDFFLHFLFFFFSRLLCFRPLCCFFFFCFFFCFHIFFAKHAIIASLRPSVVNIEPALARSGALYVIFYFSIFWMIYYSVFY
jgi:hypothetical protein